MQPRRHSTHSLPYMPFHHLSSLSTVHSVATRSAFMPYGCHLCCVGSNGNGPRCMVDGLHACLGMQATGLEFWFDATCVSRSRMVDVRVCKIRSSHPVRLDCHCPCHFISLCTHHADNSSNSSSNSSNNSSSNSNSNTGNSAAFSRLVS
jgi:hypothetical protein